MTAAKMQNSSPGVNIFSDLDMLLVVVNNAIKDGQSDNECTTCSLVTDDK